MYLIVVYVRKEHIWSRGWGVGLALLVPHLCWVAMEFKHVFAPLEIEQ
jgi:hypothetical protein